MLDCYEAKRPVRELAYLRADMEMEYDHGVPEGAAEALMELFHRPELLIEKRTKRKQLAEVDIAPMIRSIAFAEEEDLLRAAVTVRAQNPGLNPQLLEKAIARYRPDLSPDFVRVRRPGAAGRGRRNFSIKKTAPPGGMLFPSGRDFARKNGRIADI